MTTVLDTEWPDLARRLADDLEQSGKLSDPTWTTRDATNVERHMTTLDPRIPLAGSSRQPAPLADHPLTR